MKPDNEDETGLWIIGPTRDGPVPEIIYPGTWREAQDFCKDSDRPLWVQGKAEFASEAEDVPNKMVRDIRSVWGGHDDFEAGGWQYAAFVISRDLAEMEAEKWADDACVREMSDVAINALRAIDELSPFDPQESVWHRLYAHDKKGTEDIIERYQRRFENRL